MAYSKCISPATHQSKITLPIGKWSKSCFRADLSNSFLPVHASYLLLLRTVGERAGSLAKYFPYKICMWGTCRCGHCTTPAKLLYTQLAFLANLLFQTNYGMNKWEELTGMSIFNLTPYATGIRKPFSIFHQGFRYRLLHVLWAVQVSVIEVFISKRQRYAEMYVSNSSTVIDVYITNSFFLKQKLHDMNKADVGLNARL